jgi:hypothetical protein
VRSLLKQFTDSFTNESRDIALNRFSLKEVRDPEADGMKAIQEGELTGIFTRLPGASILSKDPWVCSLHM